MAARRLNEPIEPTTLGNIRANGVRSLDVCRWVFGGTPRKNGCSSCSPAHRSGAYCTPAQGPDDANPSRPTNGGQGVICGNNGPCGRLVRGAGSEPTPCLRAEPQLPARSGLRMSDLTDWPRNRLLLALSPSNLKRLMPQLEHVRCQANEVLMDADSSLDHVYLPDSGVISIVAVYADGSEIEMATIGREGCTGLQALFGAKTSSVRLLVQIPGSAAKMSRRAFMRAVESMPSFRGLMFTYAEAFIEQVLVSVACNGAHSLKQRLARWLLMMRDRSDDDILPITQNLLAEMLGVQRPSITNAIRLLERADSIECGRGQVTILNRSRLTQASCECYRLVRERVAQRLPKTYSEK
jgi:CRP-like cAMP-binding protein